MAELISLNTVIAHRGDLMTSDLSGTEAVMLNIERSSYYGLEETGKAIWDLLDEPRSIAALVDNLLTRFAVDRETCEREVMAFVNELLKEDLVRIQEAPV